MTPRRKVLIEKIQNILYFGSMDRAEPTPLDRAVAKAGTQTLLAREIGCTQQAISAARKAGLPSPGMAFKIGRFLGEAPEALWPELFTRKSGKAA